MTLAEFKSAYGVNQISLMKSSNSTRLWSKPITEHGEILNCITTTNFDTASPVFVYPVDIEGQKVYTLSNKAQGEIVATL